MMTSGSATTARSTIRVARNDNAVPNRSGGHTQLRRTPMSSFFGSACFVYRFSLSPLQPERYLHSPSASAAAARSRLALDLRTSLVYGDQKARGLGSISNDLLIGGRPPSTPARS